MSIFTIIGLLLIFMKVLEVIDISWLLAISPFAIFPIANFLRILYSDPRKKKH